MGTFVSIVLLIASVALCAITLIKLVATIRERVQAKKAKASGENKEKGE